MHTDSLFYRLFQERPETVLVYKFPQLSRAEIQTMLHLPETELKKTRFYQEVFREAEESLVSRQLKRRLGSLTAEQQGRIEHLSADDLSTLGEALLDFTQASDLDGWLQGQRGG